MIEKTDFVDLFTEKNYNYLDDVDISSYFKASEYLSYYDSLQTVGPRRDISEEIIAFNVPFLFSLENPQIAKKIDRIIKESIVGQKIDLTTSINHVAKNMNIKGFELLEITENLTFEYLKSCYRTASKKHHPDMGGKKENMQIINTAFSQFHNLLKTFLTDVNSEGNVGYISGEFGRNGIPIVKSVQDLKVVLSIQLFLIYFDLFAVDKAFNLFEYILKSILINEKYKDYFYYRNIEKIQKFALLLYKANQENSANVILNLLKEIANKK